MKKKEKKKKKKSDTQLDGAGPMNLIDAKTSDRGRRTALTFPSKKKKKKKRKRKKAFR